jgi:hypothetical protein
MIETKVTKRYRIMAIRGTIKTKTIGLILALMGMMTF